MRRILLFLAVIVAAATAAMLLPMRTVQSSLDAPAPAPLAAPVSNTAGKGARLDSGAAALADYLFVQTETAPITRSIAAAARVAIENYVPWQPPPEPAREEQTNILLNDAQIAAVKQRLELTAEQERHWPAVETALRAYVAKQYELQKKRPRALLQADPESAEVQNLQSAAAALFASLDSRQKARIRILAGMVGLGGVVAKL